MNIISNKTNIAVIFLLFLSIITHWQWFDINTILTFADWHYWHDETAKQLWYGWGTWLHNRDMGSSNIQLYFYLFQSVWSLLANLGLSYEIATKITFFIPISVLGFLSPFVLFKRIIKDNFIALVIAIFYGTGTYFLIRQTSHLPIALIYALLPLLLYFFINLIEKNRKLDIFVFALVFSIGVGYELRIMLIVSSILLLYLVIICIYKRNIPMALLKKLFISAALITILNLYWVLPLFFGSVYETISAVANRGLFGNWLFNMLRAMFFFEQSWTGGDPNHDFIPQAIPYNLLYIPILSVISLLFITKNNQEAKIKILFFAIVLILGLFMSKQTAPPFGFFYKWSFENLPVFNLYREASKYHILLALGYSGLIAYSLLFFKKYFSLIGKTRLYNILLILLMGLMLWNTKPLITGEMNTLFKPRTLPSDYQILNKFILAQDGHFRTLWFPIASRWSAYTNEKPRIHGTELVGLIDKNNRLRRMRFQNKVIKILQKQNINKILNAYNIKYVVVPIADKDNDNNFFRFYGNDRGLFVKALRNKKFLKKINIGTKELVIFENTAFSPLIYISSSNDNIPQRDVLLDNRFLVDNDLTRITPTRYDIEMKNVNKPFFLNFSERYNVNWKWQVGEFNWKDALISSKEFESDRYHTKNNLGLNTFFIDPNVIKNILSADKYHKNSDGSINFKVTIYYKDQAYYYIGMFISLLGLISMLVMIIIKVIRNRYEKYEYV